MSVVNSKETIKKNIWLLPSDKILGKTILIDTDVDESLIGGIMLRIGDQVADDTIRNRLEILKRTIENEEVA